MPSVLNPALYNRLKRCFGSVQIRAQGEAHDSSIVKDLLTEGPRLEIRNPGEYYCVCCPYCTDTRHRLYVNHMYGKRDSYGRVMKYLAVCYNETACMSKSDNVQDLYLTITEMDTMLETARIKKGTMPSFDDKTVELPGPCIKIHKLKSNHPARVYLESRGFDVEKLGKVYKVSYCLDSHYFLARERIIIPVYDHGVLRGWQARHVGDLPWKDKSKAERLPPKYFTSPNMKRRMLLYNFDVSRHYHTGVIVEGVADVWAFGAPATCTFGASMTPYQQSRFLSVHRWRAAVLLYDPEAYAEKAVQRTVEFFSKKMKGRFAPVILPEETDPGSFGSLGRSFLRDYVREQAKEQGVTVNFKRVDK